MNAARLRLMESTFHLLLLPAGFNRLPGRFFREPEISSIKIPFHWRKKGRPIFYLYEKKRQPMCARSSCNGRQTERT